MISTPIPIEEKRGLTHPDNYQLSHRPRLADVRKRAPLVAGSLTTAAPSTQAQSTSTASTSTATALPSVAASFEDMNVSLTKVTSAVMFKRIHHMVKNIVGVATGTCNKLDKEVTAISGYGQVVLVITGIMDLLMLEAKSALRMKEITHQHKNAVN